ncbi:MAG: hypothetical protein V7647_1427 [Acidobacteriota bacterium]
MTIIMRAFQGLLGQPAAQAVGWALLHFVWQGAAVGLLTAVTLALVRRSAADVRYVVSAIGLSVMFTVPVVTGAQIWSGMGHAAAAQPGDDLPRNTEAAGMRQAPSAVDAGVGSEREALRVPLSMYLIPMASAAVERWLPLILLGWLCGVAVFTARLLRGWRWVEKIKSRGTVPDTECWQLIATRLARRLHIGRPVRLLQSSYVDVPTVIGWLKPVMLLPASALAGLAPEQLEAIFAHELAHVRRHDYLVNLLQTAVETLLFYHPAVWWLSNRIRVERENCCDDLAVALCGDPVAYAMALADLEELRGEQARLVMAANGGSLVGRIRRLVAVPTHSQRTPAWLGGGLALVLLSGIAAGAVSADAFRAPGHARQVSVARPARPAGFAAEAAVRPRAEELIVRSDESEATVEPTAGASTPLRQARPARGAAEPLPASDAGGKVSARTSAPQSAAVPSQRAGSSAPAVGAASASRAAEQAHRTFSWSTDGEKLQVTYDGEAEFTDDDTDVKRLSPGGSLRIKDGWMFPTHTVDFSVEADGRITRRFWAGMSERPFEPEGRQWIAKVLPRFIRQTGIGAPARVRRILAAKGPSGVLAEIALIDGAYAKRVYFTELLKSATLDPALIRQVLAQASREVGSDFELATLLIDSADKLMIDEGSRQAYFDAARSIDSDYEMHRVYSSALKRGALAPPALATLLAASEKIDSDFEEASLLIEVARLQPLDNTTRAPFFAALATVGSDFEHHRVLSAVAERRDLSPETTAAALVSVASVQSDFEAASFLADLASHRPIEGIVRAPFFRAVETVGSSFERGRVLQAVAARPDVSNDTVVATLHAAAGMDGAFERSTVLLAVASKHSLEGPARAAYIDAAEKLGEFEQGKVLAALVKSERRK